MLITLEHLILSFGHFPSKWNQLERQETKDKYSYIPGQCMYLHTYQYTTDSVVACQQNNMHFWCSRWVTLAKSPDRFKSAAFESFTLIYDTYIWFFLKKKFYPIETWEAIQIWEMNLFLNLGAILHSIKICDAHYHISHRNYTLFISTSFQTVLSAFIKRLCDNVYTARVAICLIFFCFQTFCSSSR